MKAASTEFGPLPQLSCIRIEGKDAESFLQGQVTCDINALSVHSVTHGAHCSAKGRMVANFDAIRVDEGLLLLVCSSSVTNKLMDSLKRYSIFSKVGISLDTTFQIYGIIDSTPETELSIPGLPENFGRPTEPNQILVCDQDIVYSYDNTQFLWLTNQDRPKSNNQFDSLWSAKTCLNGRTWITEKTTGLFLPQSINLQVDAISGISFTKGCYTGQEVIARLHYKGRLKRRMHLFSCDKTPQEDSGNLQISDDQGNQIGELVDFANWEGTTYALAILSDSEAEAPCYFHGQLMSRLADPYAINN